MHFFSLCIQIQCFPTCDYHYVFESSWHILEVDNEWQRRFALIRPLSTTLQGYKLLAYDFRQNLRVFTEAASLHLMERGIAKNESPIPYDFLKNIELLKKINSFESVHPCFSLSFSFFFCLLPPGLYNLQRYIAVY